MAIFTSVSLMSTSAWNGPGGSPIISPSRWNALVASNLAVYGNHNHAASAGEGASQIFAASYFPSLDVQYIYPWFPVENTGWVMENRTYWPGMGCMSTSTLGARIAYDIYLRAGRWHLSFYWGGGDDGGMLTACWGVGNSTSPIALGIGNQPYLPDVETWLTCENFGIPDSTNFYAGGVAGSISYPFVAGTNGYWLAEIFQVPNNGRLKLIIQTKNAGFYGASGYVCRIGYIMLHRYADS